MSFAKRGRFGKLWSFEKRGRFGKLWSFTKGEIWEVIEICKEWRFGK